MKPTNRYHMISLGSADTYRITDAKSGETVAIVKGMEKAKKRVDLLNKSTSKP